jgi:hypothetical protein
MPEIVLRAADEGPLAPDPIVPEGSTEKQG